MSLAVFLFIMLITLGLLVLAIIYIPKRLANWLDLPRPKEIQIAFVLLSVLGILSMSLGAKAESFILLNAYRFGMIWLGVVLYLLFFTVLFELINWIRPIDKKLSAILVISFSLIVSAYGMWHARSYQVYQLEVPLKKLHQPIKLFHAPDIHLGPFRGKELLQQIVDDINQIQPDMVLLNGDLIDGMEGLQTDTLDLLKQINAPVFFTAGNHDIYVDIFSLKKTLKDLGVKVLDNQVVEYQNIQLVGLDYMNADNESYDPHASARRDTIKSILPTIKLDQNRPIVIMHHSPVGVKYMQQAGADLVLAGHTHAGQLFPATLFAKLQFEYSKGLYQVGDIKVYVTQGIGTFGPPMRVGTEGEATLITLVPQR